MKTEWRVFLTSIMFFTRIPVPHIPNFSDDLLNRSIRYFPFIGILVGLIGLGAWWLFLLIFPSSLALLLSMATTILLTGAFHEDGFADFCDGYGGGLDRSKILTIMKDSRLGTY
ncbi:MAG: adenosylcobinamide-GDP ribazoletransferase, partial [Bacteroidota bacterium]